MTSDSAPEVAQSLALRVAPLFRDQAYEALLEQIVTGKLQAGQPIRERAVASQLGISTTPIKEALRRLENEGFVRTQPRRGVVVSDSALTSISDVIVVRACLEGLAARLAAQRFASTAESGQDAAVGTDIGSEGQAQMRAALAGIVGHGKASLEATVEANARFHDVVRHLSGNRVIVQFVGMLLGVDSAIRRQALSHPDERQRGFDEHRAIGEAILSGLPDLAETLMREHVLRSGAHTLSAAHPAEVHSGDQAE